jgi:hypothetical protein
MNSQTHEQQYVGKTALFVLIKNAWLECVRARTATESQLSLLCLTTLFSDQLPTDTKDLFTKWVSLSSSLHPHQLSLITMNYIEWLSSPNKIYISTLQPLKTVSNHKLCTCMDFGSSALQTFNTLNSNLKFESERATPLLSIEHMLGVLVGLHVAGIGAMPLHQQFIPVTT